jgi:hypothetical protein
MSFNEFFSDKPVLRKTIFALHGLCAGSAPTQPNPHDFTKKNASEMPLNRHSEAHKETH